MKNLLKTKKYSILNKMQKRDGMIVPFDEKRITRAVSRAMEAEKEGNEKDAEAVTHKVLEALITFKKENKIKVFIPNVETIQDIVENELIASGFIQTAKAYIMYRKERSSV
ncbi:MAG: ATP cone domain-containing protein, partial [Patescibacteria group bacterium]